MMDGNDKLLQKCLILNSLLYYDDFEMKKGEYLTLSMLTSKTPIKEWKKSPEVSKEKSNYVIDEILTNPEYANYRIVNYTIGEDLPELDGISDPGIGTGGPVAMALENPETKELLFVFRGTNRLEWIDNAEGFTKEASRMQLHALKFFEDTIREGDYDKRGYTITTTGHSKGGNKAQFVTIVSQYNVDKCVNIDGQGFSPMFFEKYAKEIKEKRDRIVTMASTGDPVSQLGMKLSLEEHLYSTYGTDKTPGINTSTKSLGDRLLGYLKLSKPQNEPAVVLLSALLAHSTAAIFSVKNNEFSLTPEMPTRKYYNQELNAVSDYIMKNFSMEDQKLVFSSLMTLISRTRTNSHNRERVIVEDTPARSLKDIAKSIALLGEAGREMGYKELQRGAEKLANFFETIDKVANIDDVLYEKLGNEVYQYSKMMEQSSHYYRPDTSLDSILKEITDSKKEEKKLEREYKNKDKLSNKDEVSK